MICKHSWIRIIGGLLLSPVKIKYCYYYEYSFNFTIQFKIKYFQKTKQQVHFYFVIRIQIDDTKLFDPKVINTTYLFLLFSFSLRLICEGFKVFNFNIEALIDSIYR